MKHWRHIHVPIFNVELFVTASRKVYEGWAFPDTDVASADGLTGEDEGHIYIGIFDGRIATLAHECDHAAFTILEGCSIKVGAGEHEETHAYLLGWLIATIEPLIRIKSGA